MATLTRTWIMLSALTIGSLWAGQADTHGPLGIAGAAAVLLVAALKAELILCEFLGLRRSSPGWRLILRLFVALPLALILAAYVWAAR